VAGKSLKAAPRREVLDVERLGDWGEVRYTHRLSCGHVEERIRRTVPGKVLACSGCLKAATFAEQPLRPERAARPVFESTEDGVMIDDLAGTEAEIARIRAGLAKAFRVPVEAVDVAVTSTTGQPDVAYALVFLDADQARRVAGLTMSDLTT
jgi:hypothetical protein